jgi:short-subunit dehydrogenase
MRSTAVITGGSSGIGLELARLAAIDYDLVLIARDEAGLARAKAQLVAEGRNVDTLTLDLSAASAITSVIRVLGNRRIGLLVNNAGFATYGEFQREDISTMAGELELNVVALTQLTRAMLPAMIRYKEGRIINVASTAAFLPGPFMAVYFASKAYVLSFSVAVNEEINGTGVTVTALCPGPTATGFARRAKAERSRAFSGRLMSASEVARQGYAAAMMGKAIVVPGRVNRIQTWSLRLIPRALAARVVRRAQQP